MNRLSLNSDKTCYSIFDPKFIDVKGLNIYVNDKTIENLQCCAHLGILIDS